MTSADYRASLARLGLSPPSAARLFDVTARTGRRWASDETPVPRAVELVLAYWERDPSLLAALLAA